MLGLLRCHELAPCVDAGHRLMRERHVLAAERPGEVEGDLGKVRVPIATQVSEGTKVKRSSLEMRVMAARPARTAPQLKRGGETAERATHDHDPHIAAHRPAPSAAGPSRVMLMTVAASPWLV